MIPSLKYSLLHLPTTVLPKDQDKSNSLIWQLQVMFGSLEMSSKTFFDPTGVCNAFKDSKGKGIDVGIQQDANDFFLQLVSKVEDALKGSGKEDIFNRSLYIYNF